ncbi:hypothetical protein MJO28_016450, partial [Puccinia striiformis f. sp. tritici]
QLNREISQTSICLSSRKDFITGSWRRVTTKLPPHMDQDIPQMLVDMEKDEPLGMHNSFMQLKDFRIILQAAPFIFFQFMTPSQIKIWSSVCHLGSLIFQTPIEDMDTYISDLLTHIDIFSIIPQPLKNVYAEDEVKQIFKVNLNKKQVLKKKNYFILSQLIGGVNAIWMVQKPGNQSSYFFHTTLFQKLDENGFYRMREIQKTSHKAFVHT